MEVLHFAGGFFVFAVERSDFDDGSALKVVGDFQWLDGFAVFQV